MGVLKQCCLCLNTSVPDRYLPSGNQMHVKYSWRYTWKRQNKSLLSKDFSLLKWQNIKHKKQWRSNISEYHKEAFNQQVLRSGQKMLSDLSEDFWVPKTETHTHRAAPEREWKAGKGKWWMHGFNKHFYFFLACTTWRFPG